MDNIKQKLEFYKSINMEQIPIVHPKYLMQSVSLSYARYQFYKDRGKDITMDDYRGLFIGNKQFEKEYHITKSELLEKYNYEEYLKEKNYVG